MPDSRPPSLAFHGVVTAILSFTTFGALALLVFHIYPAAEFSRDERYWYFSYPGHLEPLFKAYLACGTVAAVIAFWRLCAWFDSRRA